MKATSDVGWSTTRVRRSVSPALLALAIASLAAPLEPRTNLVLVTLDTTRADRVGAYGDRHGAGTPALDRLARDGALFEDVTSPAPLTLPAHCTLLTGQLPPRHGIRENADRLDAATPTLATALKTQGYRTGAFVGSLVLARSRGLSRGFDVYDDDIPLHGQSGSRPRRKADAVVDRALRWMGEARGSPFFAWLHFYDAHVPYESMPPFNQAHHDRPYEAAVASVDAQIGRLRTYLDQYDLTRRTIFAVIGDHGEGLGDHGELTHGLFVYQSVLRVPFILHAPAMALRGHRVRAPVSSADLTPTLLHLLRAPAPDDLDGRSLAPLLRRPTPEAARDVYAENLYVQRFNWSEMHAIRSGSLKLIDKTRPELYDLEHDPGESCDLSMERPDVVARLTQRLRAWQDRLAAGKPPIPEAARAAAADVRAHLLSLGYISDAAVSKGAAGEPSGSDPRDHVAIFNCFMARAAEPPSQGLLLKRSPCGDQSRPPFTARR